MPDKTRDQLLLETELLRARVKELEKAASYIDLFDGAPILFASVDATTAEILDCNQTLADTLGYTKDELIGRPVFDMYHPDCVAQATASFENFVRTGKVIKFSRQLSRRDGSSFDVSLDVSPVRDAQGNIICGWSIWHDITERKQAERSMEQIRDGLEGRVRERGEQLAESEARWRSLVSTAPDLILILNPDATIRYINRTMQGYRMEDVIGTSGYENSCRL